MPMRPGGTDGRERLGTPYLPSPAMERSVSHPPTDPMLLAQPGQRSLEGLNRVSAAARQNAETTGSAVSNGAGLE